MARKPSALAPARRYTRFSLASRLQHLVMLVSFTTLGVTGLVQKFALHPVSVLVIRVWGGVESIRTTHHIAAIVLMLVAIYHLVELGYKAFVLRTRLSMLPGLHDLQAAWAAFLYNLGMNKSRPQMGRYTFEEKAEYWALVWGVVIMGFTGFMMWNPLSTIRLLPGEFIPAAKAAHGAEAILAVLAIIVWHMYGVHVKQFNKAMWTGDLTEDEMLHEHPLELADLKAGLDGQRPEPASVRRRQMIYYPVAAVVGLALLFGVYGFVGGEKTAITTVPPQLESGPVFVPQTPTALPPTSTPAPTATPAATEALPAEGASSVTWGDVGPFFASKCIMCHGPALASAGLTLDTFANAMKGSQTGPVVIAGDPQGSQLIAVQSAGEHPAQLSEEEMATVSAWIEAGALER